MNREQEQQQGPGKWEILPEDVWGCVLSYFDMVIFIKWKRVNRHWEQVCTQVIDAKRTMAFATNQELSDAVKKYCGVEYPEDRIFPVYRGLCSLQEAEELASHQKVGCIQPPRLLKYLLP